MTPPNVIQHIYLLISLANDGGDANLPVNYVANWIDKALSEEKFSEVVEVLDGLDTDKLPVNIITGILTITIHAKNQLGDRRINFRNRCLTSLEYKHELSPERIKSITIRM